MKMRRTVVFLVGILFFVSCTKEEVLLEEPQSTTAENNLVLEGEVLELVNAHRASLALEPLQFSEVAYTYANQHTDYMIAKGNLSHDHFSSRANNIYEAVAAEEVAENVAKDYTTAEDTFQGWYESSSHKKTMEGDYTHTAVSVKKNEAGAYYYTQLFYRE